MLVLLLLRVPHALFWVRQRTRAIALREKKTYVLGSHNPAGRAGTSYVIVVRGGRTPHPPRTREESGAGIKSVSVPDFFWNYVLWGEGWGLKRAARAAGTTYESIP
jgi:hypothetical protein